MQPSWPDTSITTATGGYRLSRATGQDQARGGDKSTPPHFPTKSWTKWSWETPSNLASSMVLWSLHDWTAGKNNCFLILYMEIPDNVFRCAARSVLVLKPGWEHPVQVLDRLPDAQVSPSLWASFLGAFLFLSVTETVTSVSHEIKLNATLSF